MPLIRGARKGNQNRVTHGRFTAAAMEERAELNEKLRAMRATMKEAKALAKAIKPRRAKPKELSLLRL